MHRLIGLQMQSEVVIALLNSMLETELGLNSGRQRSGKLPIWIETLLLCSYPYESIDS